MTRAILVLCCLAPSYVSAQPLTLPSSVFLAAQAADLHSTSIALSQGHREVNPMLRNGTARILIKGAASAAIIYKAHELSRRGKRKQARILLYVVSAGTAAMAARNYRIGGTP